MGGSSSKVHGGEEMGGAVHLWGGGPFVPWGVTLVLGGSRCHCGEGVPFYFGGAPFVPGNGGVHNPAGGGAPIVFGEIIFYLGKGPISGGGGVEKLAVQQLKGGGGCPMGGRGVLPLPPPLPPH